VDPKDLACLRRARDLIDREYARPLDVPALARVALMSTVHFARQFRAACGETPGPLPRRHRRHPVLPGHVRTRPVRTKQEQTLAR